MENKTSTIDIFKFVNRNLFLLLKAPENCFYKNEFIVYLDGEACDVDYLINMMLAEDMIEIEDENDLYYLTQFGFEIAIKGNWYSEKYDYVTKTQEQSKEETVDVGLSSGETPWKSPFSKFSFWALLIVVLLFLGYKFGNKTLSKKNISNSDTIIIQSQLDSIKNIKESIQVNTQ